MSRRTIYIVAGSIIGLMVLVWAGMAATSGPKFCGTMCHVMVPYYESHAASKHKYMSCSDCHVPNDNYAYKVYYKGKSGYSHIYHNIKGDYPIVLELAEDSKEILQTNCNRCHSTTMKGVHSFDVKEKPCYTCHQGIAHPNFRDEIEEQAKQKK